IQDIVRKQKLEDKSIRIGIKTPDSACSSVNRSNTGAGSTIDGCKATAYIERIAAKCERVHTIIGVCRKAVDDRTCCRVQCRQVITGSSAYIGKIPARI